MDFGDLIGEETTAALGEATGRRNRLRGKSGSDRIEEEKGRKNRIPGELSHCLIQIVELLPSLAMADASASSRKQSLPETWSRCHAQTITAAHNFRVTNFSLLEGMGATKFVDSKSFSVGGSNWTIRLYPDGRETEPEAEASAVAFLWFKEGETRVRVKYSLDLLGTDGVLLYEFEAQYTFEEIEWGSGWTIKKSDLRPLLRLNNDSFTLRCVLTVIKDPKVEDASTIVVPQSSLLQDLAQMLKDGDGTDVTFRVGERLFPAHRCVLAARSLVFKAELFGPMKEKVDAEHVIAIDDMEPSVFEALLHYIYTDSSLPGHDWDAGKNVPLQHLLVAADRYGVDRLRLMCEEKVCSAIDVETVASTLALAEQHHCAQLKKACLSFIASRGVLSAVMQTDDFEHLAASCPLVLLDILDSLASLGN